MRYLVAVCSVLLLASGGAAQPAISGRCPESAVAAVLEEVRVACSCCDGPRRCATGLARAAVRDGRLPARCVGAVRRGTTLLCRALRRRGVCDQTGGCFDTIGNGCIGVPCRLGTRSGCPAFNVLCTRECGPSGGDFLWRETCGDPVCRVDGDVEHPGVPPCTPEQRSGAACATPGMSCDPFDSCNALLVCSANELAINCPISQRATKDRIEYLDAGAAQRVHDELMRYPLATWRYKQGTGDRHLGFIIEDVTPSAAIMGDGAHVDLYSYTSMAVAALQVQAREITKLRRQVDRLNRRLAHAQR